MSREFRLLGTLEVRDDGSPVEIGARKQRELLAALLLAEGASVSDDRIQEALWGDRPPKNTKGSIQVYISQLRSSLHDSNHSLIQRTDHGYRLLTEADTVDIRVLGRLVSDGLHALDAGRHSIALRLLDDSLGMLSGDLLSDFVDAEFARPTREHLNQLRWSALEGRLEARLALGSHRQVVTEAKPLLQEDPFNENIWAMLMTALYQSHRRAEALRCYQIAVSELAEAGLEPTTRLTTLESKILRQDPALLPSKPKPPSNLPDGGLPGGDKRVVTMAADALHAGALVTMSGPPQKTRSAAIESARRSRTAFPDGIWLVDLEHRGGNSYLGRAVLDALGVIAGPDPDATLTESLRTRSVLLVLLDADEAVAEIARLAADIRSAQDGRSDSQLLVTVSSLPNATALSFGATFNLSGSPTDPESSGAATNADLLLARMSIFGGPVTLDAIRQVTAFLPLDESMVSDLVAQLVADDMITVDNSSAYTRFSAAASGTDDRVVNRSELIARHREYSFDLAGRLVDGLDGPARRDLLNAAKAEHEELRVAAKRATAEGDWPAALRVAHGAGRYWSIEGSHLGRTVTVLEPLVEHVSASTTDGAGLLLSLGFAHFRSGSYAAAARCYDQAVELTEHGLDPIALAGRARAERGHLRMFLNDTEGATADLDAALGLADSAGSAALRARVLMLQAQLEMRTPIAFGRSEQRERLDDAIRTFHRLGHFSGQANSLLVKSSWFIDADQPKEAVAAAEKALEIVQLADDRSMLAFALVRSSESLFVAGDRRLAHERALEAALVAVDVGNWLVVGLALLAAAVSAVERSSFDAEESIEAFVTIRRHLGVPLTERELRWASELGFDLASNPDVGKLAEGSTSVPVPAEIGEVVRGLCEGASVS